MARAAPTSPGCRFGLVTSSVSHAGAQHAKPCVRHLLPVTCVATLAWTEARHYTASEGLPQKDHMIAIDLEKSKGSGGAVKGLLIGQKANVEKAKKEIEEISVRFCLGGAPT